MSKNLVIVESPTKARTISRFLGKDFVVESSIGHIRDLPDSAKDIPEAEKKKPWSRLGIDLDNNFAPLYVVPSEKKAHVAKLKKLLKGAENLYLATDEDREGESISWHLMEVLKPKVPTHRLVFHEITKAAIEKALQTPREIDTRLVSAQETRRMLDRLYGYQISPVLWRKIAPSLSAGRVQSVSVRLMVERERARMAFQSADYWDLEGAFESPEASPFKANLLSLDGKRIASGKDFDETTGALKAKSQAVLLAGEETKKLAESLTKEAFTVTKVEEKPFTNQSPPPFITSTLQQEANRKLKLSSQETMRVAQSLYERGFITYMRTDSTTLSGEALKASRKEILSRYGKEYLPDEPKVYASKVKNAQEAHEAIRPSGHQFRTPETLKGELNPAEFQLYDMIWKRTLASQMTQSRGMRMTLQVSGGPVVFQTTGRRIIFPGFLRAYVEGSDDPEADLGDQERLLPDVKEGQKITPKAFDAREHHTQPPSRFTEASLIRDLEREGIGRPSTYASIIATVVARRYVIKRGSTLIPTFTAFAVVQLLEQHFSKLVDYSFTAKMEDILDAISRGEQESLPYLKEFYFGAPPHPGLADLLEAEIDPREACTISLGLDSEKAQVNVRIGKFGPYLERGETRASLPADLVPDELTMEKAETLLEKENLPDEPLGTEPNSGQNVYIKDGRYGPYVQLGETGEEPKYKSLLPGQEPETINLDQALQLLSLPREVGKDADDVEITVDLGRYGPYMRRGKDTRTLSDAALLFTISLAEALEMLAQPKAARKFGPQPIKTLGKHPQTEAEIQLMKGRFGPYVTDGEINASVPRAQDPQTLTLEEAVGLLLARAAKGPVVKKKKAAKKPAKKTAAKKASPKKAAAKTTTTKKTVVKKAATKKAPAKKTAAKKPAAKKKAAS